MKVPAHLQAAERQPPLVAGRAGWPENIWLVEAPPHRVTLHRVTPYRVTPYRVTLYRVTPYPSAATPALATCSSSCDCTPETPMAPTHSPCTMIGTPPWIGVLTGALANAGRSLMRSSQNLVGRREIAEDSAFPMAIFDVKGPAPSGRSSQSG